MFKGALRLTFKQTVLLQIDFVQKGRKQDWLKKKGKGKKNDQRRTHPFKLPLPIKHVKYI